MFEGRIREWPDGLVNAVSPSDAPNQPKLSNISLRSINLVQPIAEHGHYDMDKIAKLVVRYTKIFDTLEQSFPTRFHKPDIVVYIVLIMI
ncbi:unnamed protein product [Rotaria sp. Silwood1]|nr:unnamed protein product [Rotaria sp. Silwood1]CAF1604279.1 unnamed protein product [Rotaria sp. Silwood1]CAF3720802.1 unnamed protein product [Rotaria sp. Silwood1]